MKVNNTILFNKWYDHIDCDPNPLKLKNRSFSLIIANRFLFAPLLFFFYYFLNPTCYSSIPFPMTETSQFIYPSILRFYGFYDHKSMLMGNLLRSMEYSGLMENGITVAPPDETHETTFEGIKENKIKRFESQESLVWSIGRSIILNRPRIFGMLCAASIMIFQGQACKDTRA